MAKKDESFVANIARLTDPQHVLKPILNDDGSVKVSAERRLTQLQEKISVCMTRMYQKAGNGGHPFLFYIAGPKEHFLADKLPGNDEFKTAATNGKYFFWFPEFLEALEHHQVSTIMMHEANHILYGHCTPGRGHGKDHDDWAIAIDYTNNATLELGLERAREEAKTLSKTLPDLWGAGILGKPVLLKELLDWIDGKLDKINQTEGQIRCFSDTVVLNRGPESVYYEIMQHKMNSPRRCKTCGALSIDPKTGKSTLGKPPFPPGTCPKCGAKPNSMCLGHGVGSLDSHMDSALTKEQVMGEMIQAAEKAANFGRGYVPAGIEAALAELKAPTLSPHDIIVNAMQRKAMDAGMNSDFSHMKRRPQFLYEKNEKGEFVPKHKLYNPRKFCYSPRWVCMFDTSGSMSDQDIANGISELQAVASMQDSEGWMVPCDATPHWEHKVQITCSSDIKRSRVFGRGGTIFDDFFKELPKEIGTDLDVVVLVTDGDCGGESLAQALRPACDVLWIITNDRPFKPSFGRVVSLRPARN
jgi:predicted metal-dependent peptidase